MPTTTLNLKDALRAEEAGGVLTAISSATAARILSETDAHDQPLLHRLMAAAHKHAVASEEFARVYLEVRQEHENAEAALQRQKDAASFRSAVLQHLPSVRR